MPTTCSNARMAENTPTVMAFLDELLSQTKAYARPGL